MRAEFLVLIVLGWAVAACGDAGPDADFVRISAVAVTQVPEVRWPDASTGTMTVDCGRNERGHRNADNFITQPGVTGGAHHTHDYVGNTSSDAMSTDATLAAADTTCVNGDRSTYFWPVLRLREAGHDQGGGTGGIVEPAFVDILFTGNPAHKVIPMPRFLRIITGDSKALTSGGLHARARWSCSDHPNRVTSSYPLCSPQERVVRTFEFPSCWDGRNTDSQDHRAHTAFPGPNGECPRATYPIPRLVLKVGYAVPDGPSFQIDSFPEQRNSPTTDHGDFVNVMSDDLMTRMVDCLNSGRSC